MPPNKWTKIKQNQPSSIFSTTAPHTSKKSMCKRKQK
jgi:hypothetical protein